jgi:hypothetical protein
MTQRSGSHCPWDISNKGRKSKELRSGTHRSGQFGIAHKTEIRYTKRRRWRRWKGRVRNRGEEGQRGGGTEGRRDRGEEGQRGGWSERKGGGDVSRAGRITFRFSEIIFRWEKSYSGGNHQL